MRSPSRPFSSNETSKSSKSISPDTPLNLPSPVPSQSHSLTSTLSPRNIAQSLQKYSVRKKLKFSQNTAATITQFPSKKELLPLSPATITVYPLPSSRCWINISKTTCVKALFAILNPQRQRQFCSSGNPMAPYDYASITAVSTKSRSRIDILFPSLPNSSTSVEMPGTSRVSISAMVITYCGWRWDRNGKLLFAVAMGYTSIVSCHLGYAMLLEPSNTL